MQLFCGIKTFLLYLFYAWHALVFFTQMTRLGSWAKSVVARIKALRSLIDYAMRVWGT